MSLDKICLLYQIPGYVKELLSKVPFIDVVTEVEGFHYPDEFVADESIEPDFIFEILLPTERKKLVCHVEVNGQPRFARKAVDRLLHWVKTFPGSYGVFIAPYISEKSAEICTRSNIGYIDLSGNYELTFGFVYIERSGFPNINSEDRSLLSLFSPKSERVLRALFENTNKEWSTNKLAHEAKVSVGQSSNVRKLLRDNEYIEEGSGGFKLKDPLRLLMEWQKKYNFKKHIIEEFYSFDSVPEIEAKLAEVCARKNIDYAFTGFSGAARYAPHVNYQKAMVYIDVPKNQAGPITNDIGLKRVGSGGKIDLVIPYEDGVFNGFQLVDGVKIASPIQVYLDLKSLAGRGDEAADFLLEEVIKPQW